MKEGRPGRRASFPQTEAPRGRGTPLIRCAGAPRPARARQLCAGRSPGSRWGSPGDPRPSRLLTPRGAQWHLERPHRLQLRGQPRPGRDHPGCSRSRFSPCGPPAHGRDVAGGAAQGQRHFRLRNMRKFNWCAARQLRDMGRRRQGCAGRGRIYHLYDDAPHHPPLGCGPRKQRQLRLSQSEILQSISKFNIPLRRRRWSDFPIPRVL